MKKLLSLLLTLILCFSFCACSNKKGDTVKNDWETIINSNKIKIGVFESEYTQKDETGFYGVNIDIIDAVCNDIGLTYDIIEVDPNNYTAAIDNGTVDCVWGVMYNNTIEEKYDCSIPYIITDEIVIFSGSRATQFPTKESLKSLTTVIAVNGSLAYAAATDAGISCGEAKDTNEALLRVLGGSADACVVDFAMAQNYLSNEEYAALEIGLTLVSFDNVIVYSKGSYSNTSIRSSLKKLTENGTLDSIAGRYGLAAQLPSNRFAQ